MCTIHQWGGGVIRLPFIDSDLEVSFKACLTVFHKCTYIQNDGRRSSYINVYRMSFFLQVLIQFLTFCGDRPLHNCNHLSLII